MCKTGDAMKTNAAKTSEHLALTLMEMMLVVAVIGVLLALFLPALMKPRARASRINCVNNLKQIGLAFRQWALDNSDRFPVFVSVTNGGTMELVPSGNVFPHFQVMSNELYMPKILVCPAETRPPATSWTSLSNSNISYFIVLDAEYTQPQMFLSGDSNLEVDGKPVGPGILNLQTNSAVAWTASRHVRQGNVAFLDGSVQGFSSVRLRSALANSGITNRLAIP
jgi:prepilin-type processing-associated H-X9-DG protein